jgi:tetratricopeptide (TPR) repeat protein
MEDGFTRLDPSHPLGGRDGKKDAIAWRSNQKWVMAVYFPRGKKPFNETKSKFISDFAGVSLNTADGLAFVTNQELSLGERAELLDSISGPAEIYHLEKITAILDKPGMRSVRAQFLGIDYERRDYSKSKPVFVRIIPKISQPFGHLIGRDQEAASLSEFLRPTPTIIEGSNTVVITGMPGVGKSALATQAASSSPVQERFLGGSMAIDFNGYALDPNDRVMPHQVLSSILLALGCTDVQSDPGIMFVHFQSFLAELDSSGKPTLLLFDNVSQADQIESLIPRSGNHKVIVTSRNSLTSRLGSPTEINLKPLATSEGVSLIIQASHSSNSAPEPSTDGKSVDLERLAHICAGLPIALQLVGEILRNEEALTPKELVNELSSEHSRLEGLEFQDATLRAIFQGSYVRLPDLARKCFRYISVHPGQEFSVDSIAAMTGEESIRVRRVFRALEGSHLIVRTLGRATWAMHDLLRLYSTELFGLEDGQKAAQPALYSLYDYYFTTLEQANEWLNATFTAETKDAFKSLQDARTWMSTEVDGIVASVERSSKFADHLNVYRLGISLCLYLGIIGDRASSLDMAEMALSAARALQDPEKIAAALNNVGLSLNSLQQFERAKGIFIEASKKYRSIGNKSGEATVLLGLCDVLRADGSIQQTVGPLRRALRLNTEDGDVRGAATVMTNLGITYREGGNFAEAIDVLSAALKAHEEMDAQWAKASTLVQLGTALMQSGDHEKGLVYLTRGRDCAKDLGDIVGLTSASVNIGNLYRKLGDLEAARGHYLYALEQCEGVNDLGSLALALWNMIALCRELNDRKSFEHYLARLQSIPSDALPPQLRMRIHMSSRRWRGKR